MPKIDILVDLGGHTPNSRLCASARKPALVLATWLGYPNTTGLAAMDYRLTNAWADPIGVTDVWHTEALERPPHGLLCYEPPPKHLFCRQVGGGPVGARCSCTQNLSRKHSSHHGKYVPGRCQGFARQVEAAYRAVWAKWCSPSHSAAGR